MISLMADYNDNMIKYGILPKDFYNSISYKYASNICVRVCVGGGGGGGGGSVLYMIKSMMTANSKHKESKYTTNLTSEYIIVVVLIQFIHFSKNYYLK